MWTPKQLEYARAIVAEGRRLGITERGLIIGLATSLVECDLVMYANRADPDTLNFPFEKIGSDSKSGGLFQQQPPWWGTAADRMSPTGSARMFFEALKKLDYNGPRSPGSYAQKVQGSSFPDRYDKRMGQATELFRLLGDTTLEVPPVGWSGDPVWLADVLRAEGLICDVFKDANADAFGIGQGDFRGIWGLVVHHTGDQSGRADNPGAIARHPTLGLASQLHLNRDGKYTLCGVGIAYHAGVGSWPGIPKNDANSVTIGIEAENSGKEGWSPKQYDAYVRGVAAILWRLGHGSDHVIGHKEWGAIQGKWDPGGIDMNAFRRDVEARLAIKRNPIAPTPTPVTINEIEEAAKRAPWVGKRIRPEELSVGKDGKGRLGVYEFAHIYFYPGIGAFPIPGGGLFEAFAGLDYERGTLGYPVREFAPLDGPSGKGAVQAFQGGVLYRKDGAGNGFIVYGEIGKRWADEGYENGPLGWPVANEFVDSSGNRVQLFENGSLYWHSSGVAKLAKVA